MSSLLYGSGEAIGLAEKSAFFVIMMLCVIHVFFKKNKDIKLQQLLREFLFWTCKYNFFPIVEKIGTKENCIADFLSRVHVQSEIDIYFESLDYPRQKRLSVPSELLSFKAEW